MTPSVPHGHRVIVGRVDAGARRVGPADLVLVVSRELGGFLQGLLHGIVLSEGTHVITLACTDVVNMKILRLYICVLESYSCMPKPSHSTKTPTTTFPNSLCMFKNTMRRALIPGSHLTLQR